MFFEDFLTGKVSNVNVAENPDAIKILKQGIRNSDDVASEYMSKVRPVARGINTETSDLVNNSLTSKINVPETIKAERALYGDYMDRFGNDEIFNFAPTKEQILSYPAESKFNLPKGKLTRDEAEDILFRKAKDSEVEVSGSKSHYLDKNDRGQYVRTLSNTLRNPDIKYTMDVKNNNGDIVNREYLAKKYNGVSKDGESPFFDFIIKEDNKLFNKFKPKNMSYIDTQLQKNPQDVSLSGRLMGAEPTHGLPISYTNNIPLKNIVVNPNLPHINSLYKGLTDFQAKELDAAKAKKDEEAAAKKAEREKALEDTKNSLNNLKNTFTR